MRTVIAAAVVSLLACNQRSTPEEEVETGAFDPGAAVHETADAVRVEVHRRDVPLEAMPIVAAALGGLPVSGMADIDIDLTAPNGHARRATGDIAVACTSGCTIGDGTAKLAARDLPPLDFDRLAIDKLDAQIHVGDGRVELTRWDLASKDIALGARLRIDLADALDASTVDGCIWFKPAADLATRAPRTAAVIATTGAAADADGYFQIKVSGTVGARKYLAQACRAR